MPSCNLAETVHNKQLRQFENQGIDLYIATIDDFVIAFIQIVRYYQYLKDDGGRMGLGKKELWLQIAQRLAECSGNPKVLTEVISSLPEIEELFSKEPHL